MSEHRNRMSCMLRRTMAWPRVIPYPATLVENPNQTGYALILQIHAWRLDLNIDGSNGCLVTAKNPE
jgi:hypothetical protein